MNVRVVLQVFHVYMIHDTFMPDQFFYSVECYCIALAGYKEDACFI